MSYLFALKYFRLQRIAVQLATAAKPQLDLNKATSTKKETVPNLPNKGKLGRLPQLDYIPEKEYDVFKI